MSPELERVQEYNSDGVHLFHQGEYAAARDSFSAALKLKPNDPALLFNLGQCQDRLDDPATAEQTYRACLALAPDHAECHHALAVLLVRTGHRDAAEKSVQDWLARSPKLAAPYAEDAWLIHEAGDLPRARARCQQALAIDPHNPQALIEMGRIYEALQRPEFALTLYEDALRQNPNEVEVARRVSRLKGQGVGRPIPD